MELNHPWAGIALAGSIQDQLHPVVDFSGNHIEIANQYRCYRQVISLAVCIL
jgi:hypothetical protein